MNLIGQGESCGCDRTVPHDCVCKFCRERWLEWKVERYEKALEALAKLGNGERYGNSTGNEIAQRALQVGSFEPKESAESEYPAAILNLNQEEFKSSFIFSSRTSEEILRISENGFWVKGVKVEQDSEEAKKVYEAFRICLNNLETVKIIRELQPVIRDIFWLARCWNDHNFSEGEVLKRCQSITDRLVGDSKMDGVEVCNNWLDRIDKL